MSNAIEGCNSCGILSCRPIQEGWELSDGADRTVTFSGGLDCVVRNADVNEEPTDLDEARLYMVRLLNNVGMPDIAKALHQQTIFLAKPSDNNQLDLK